MKRILFAFTALTVCLSPVPALAEQIIVINRDGTVTISDSEGKLPEQTLEQPKPEQPAPATQASPAPIPVQPAPAPVPPAAEGTAVLTPPAPSPASKPAATTVAPEKTESDSIHPGTPDPGIPKEQSIGRVDPKYKPPERQARPVGPDEAKRIALDVAPPSRGIDVYPADYQGTKVWQVIFKTEDGDRYVLVERATGAIIEE